MLNEIKCAVRDLDYSDAKLATMHIYQKYELKAGIADDIQTINDKMSHIDKSRYFNVDEYDRLMLFAEFNGSKREQYSREYDRILVTKSFRHLQYKTQIMVNSASDDQRTRLLHSLEVQRIAKTLALQLGANSNLAQTIAIGHDVGHAPFGHAGERALSGCLSKGYFGEFTHALQSVKVLNYLEEHPIVKRYGLRGLGLGVEVLSGILKHDTDTFYKDVSAAAFRLQYDCPKILNYYPGEKNETLDRHSPIMGTIEAQIVYWADKIAYIGHDWEEFVLSSHVEKLLHDMNEIWDKMGIALALYETNQRKIKPEKLEEYKKLKKIQEVIMNMKGRFTHDKTDLTQTKSDKTLTKHQALKESLNKYIDDLLKIEREMMLQEKVSSTKSVPTAGAETGQSKINCTLLSRNEYNMLFDYFRVTQAWMYITDRNPKEYNEHNDIMFPATPFLRTTERRPCCCMMRSTAL